MKQWKRRAQAAGLLLAFGLTLTGCGGSQVESPKTQLPVQTADLSETAPDLPPMVMADGVLYLDTGEKSTQAHTCAAMLRQISSTVESSQRPAVDGQSNFGTGYDYEPGADGTMDVEIGGSWWVFESEARRQARADTWGIALAAQDVTPTGMTLACTQSGGQLEGRLQTGSFYVLEQRTGDHWAAVPHQIEDLVWTDEAWEISTMNTQLWKIQWEFLYGSLPAGSYRLGKDVMHVRATGDYDTSRYYAEFIIP